VSMGRVGVKKNLLATDGGYDEPSGYQEDPDMQHIYWLPPTPSPGTLCGACVGVSRAARGGTGSRKTLVKANLEMAIHIFFSCCSDQQDAPRDSGVVFLLGTQDDGHSPSNLMRVCRLWRNLIMDKARSSFMVGTRTAPESVESTLRGQENCH
jgi:hypothetical protein